MAILDILLILALAAVTITLAFGIYSLMRGGQFAKSHSNRLMRLRVALQFLAIVILVIAFWFKQQAGG